MEEYIKELKQEIKNLEQELKVTKEDRDQKAKMAIALDACVLDIYENAKTLEEAKGMISKYLHNAVTDIKL